MSEAMSMRELEEIEKEHAKILRKGTEWPDYQHRLECFMEYEAPKLLSEVCRSHAEAAELHLQLGIITEERNQWDGNYCDLRVEADKLEAENAELRNLLGEVRRYLRTLNRSKANSLVRQIENAATEEEKRWINLGF